MTLFMDALENVEQSSTKHLLTVHFSPILELKLEV